MVHACMYVCGRVHAATQANIDTLKFYLGQGTSVHYDPSDASLVLMCSSYNQYRLIIIDTRACNRK